MDWSKAKTILIVALLVANSILAYFLYFDDIYANSTTDDSFILRTQKILLNKDIKIDTEIPLTTKATFNLSVEYQKYEPLEINRNFFDGNGIRESMDSTFTEIYRDNENVTIINDKLLIYEYLGDMKDKGINSLEAAKAEAEAFLIDRAKFNSDTNDLVLSYYRETDYGYYLEYTKVLDGMYIEQSFTTFRVENGGVRKMERTWLNIKQIEDTNIEIVSAPKAILELISHEQVYNKTITDISLCYYFDPEKQDYFGDYQSATEGKAVPAWRVLFHDGYKMILDIN